MVNSETKKTGAVLVQGGGIAGLQASIDLANSGFKVFLVERSESIGGTMVMLDKTFPTGDCAMCMISPKLVEVSRHPNIEVNSMTDVVAVDGEPGTGGVVAGVAVDPIDGGDGSAEVLGCGGEVAGGAVVDDLAGGAVGGGDDGGATGQGFDHDQAEGFVPGDGVEQGGGCAE